MEKLAVAIPSSALINETDEKIKTYKLGIIGRALAIFRVEEVIIYRDPILDETDFIKAVLEYLETPQYLRKGLVPIDEKLRFVGVIPPLAIPSHKSKHLKIGELREGVVKRVAPDGTRWVDIGVEALAPLKCEEPKGARVTVRVVSKTPLLVEKAKADEYWGYKVKEAGLEEVLKRKDVIVASRKGRVPRIGELRMGTFVFGNPKEGVFEIMKRMGIDMEVEAWNTIPMQGVRNVRLEEAIISTLAIVNFFSFWGGLK
ncbi:MAG: putative RNA uridine N3 methyltransferase [Archaeoglobaceae archaeon]